MNKKYYNCFSYRQKEYLLAMGANVYATNVHYKTGKRFWVFKMNKTVEVALKAWTYHSDLVIFK